jgi:hypothetical protein
MKTRKGFKRCLWSVLSKQDVVTGVHTGEMERLKKFITELRQKALSKKASDPVDPSSKRYASALKEPPSEI